MAKRQTKKKSKKKSASSSKSTRRASRARTAGKTRPMGNSPKVETAAPEAPATETLETKTEGAETAPEAEQYEDPVDNAIAEVTGKLSGAYAAHKARIDLFAEFAYGRKTELTDDDRATLELNYLIKAAEKIVEKSKGEGYDTLVAVFEDEDKTEITEEEAAELHDYKDVAEALCSLRKDVADYKKKAEKAEQAEKLLEKPYKVVAAAGSVDEMLKDTSTRKRDRTAMEKAMKAEPDQVYAVAARSMNVAQALVDATLEDGQPTELTARVNSRIGKQRVYASLVALEDSASTAFNYDPEPAKAAPKKK